MRIIQIIYICATVILFLSVFTHVPVSAENKCPNNLTDSFRKKCYSLHTEWPDYWKNYNQALQFCQRSGGNLLSDKTTEEDEDFLRELYTKIHRWTYWVGGYRYNDWKYLSDNTTIPERLIKKNPESENCLAIRLSQNKLVPESCESNSYYICVYSGDECDQGLCYQISYTKETFNGAMKKCKQLGSRGELLEIRNEQDLAFYKHEIRKHRTFTFLTTKEQDELTFPWIWKQRSPSFSHTPCEIYTFKNTKPEKYNCDENFGFVCEYQAKKTYTSITAISNITNSLLNSLFLPRLETTTTKSSYEKPKTSSESLSSQSTTSSVTNPTATPRTATTGNYNLPMGNSNKKTTKLISISIAVAVLILIGIVILIILLVKIIRKNGKANNEAVYLEPIVHNKQNTIPKRHSMLRELPDPPHNSNSCIRSTSNVSECESLQNKPEFQEPLQDIYIYID